jgi:uncharacterized protein (TIGR02391 family)
VPIRYTGERDLVSQLVKVSSYIRYRTIHRESVPTLFIGDPKEFPEGYSISSIIGMFPSLVDRKLRALSNIQALSEYFGAKVKFEQWDYTVFYPEVKDVQSALMIMKSLVDDGLVLGEVKFPTELVISDKGVSLLSAQVNSAPLAPLNPTKPAAQSDKLDGLHPKVLAVAKKLFEDGHFRSAVLDTYVALNNEVQQKSGLQIDGSALMQKAFSKDNPILKVPGGNDPQLGAMWLFTSAVMGVRNILAHNAAAHPTDLEALEWLHFASALHRILDSSTL